MKNSRNNGPLSIISILLLYFSVAFIFIYEFLTYLNMYAGGEAPNFPLVGFYLFSTIALVLMFLSRTLTQVTYDLCMYVVAYGIARFAGFAVAQIVGTVIGVTTYTAMALGAMSSFMGIGGIIGLVILVVFAPVLVFFIPLFAFVMVCNLALPNSFSVNLSNVMSLVIVFVSSLTLAAMFDDGQSNYSALKESLFDIYGGLRGSLYSSVPAIGQKGIKLIFSAFAFYNLSAAGVVSPVINDTVELVESIKEEGKNQEKVKDLHDMTFAQNTGMKYIIDVSNGNASVFGAGPNGFVSLNGKGFLYYKEKMVMIDKEGTITPIDNIERDKKAKNEDVLLTTDGTYVYLGLGPRIYQIDPETLKSQYSSEGAYNYLSYKNDTERRKDHCTDLELQAQREFGLGEYVHLAAIKQSGILLDWDKQNLTGIFATANKDGIDIYQTNENEDSLLTSFDVKWKNNIHESNILNLNDCIYFIDDLKVKAYNYKEQTGPVEIGIEAANDTFGNANFNGDMCVFVLPEGKVVLYNEKRGINQTFEAKGARYPLMIDDLVVLLDYQGNVVARINNIF